MDGKGIRVWRAALAVAWLVARLEGRTVVTVAEAGSAWEGIDVYEVLQPTGINVLLDELNTPVPPVWVHGNHSNFFVYQAVATLYVKQLADSDD